MVVALEATGAGLRLRGDVADLAPVSERGHRLALALEAYGEAIVEQDHWPTGGKGTGSACINGSRVRLCFALETRSYHGSAALPTTIPRASSSTLGQGDALDPE